MTARRPANGCPDKCVHYRREQIGILPQADFGTRNRAAGLERFTIVGGLNDLGAALFRIGIPKNSLLVYESAIGAGKFALVVLGTPDDVARAKDILKHTEADAIDNHESVDQHDVVV